MITTPITADLIHGIAELEQTARGLRPHRLPAATRAQFPDPQLMMVEAQPSGARLTAATAARTLALVLVPTRVGYRGVDRPRGHVDLVVDGVPIRSEALAGGDLIDGRPGLDSGPFGPLWMHAVQPRGAAARMIAVAVAE